MIKLINQKEISRGPTGIRTQVPGRILTRESESDVITSYTIEPSGALRHEIVLHIIKLFVGWGRAGGTLCRSGADVDH